MDQKEAGSASSRLGKRSHELEDDLDPIEENTGIKMKKIKRDMMEQKEAGSASSQLGKRSHELDEDDLDLIEENTGIKMKSKKKYKRLKTTNDKDDNDLKNSIADELFADNGDKEVEEKKEIANMPEESKDDFIVNDNSQPVTNTSSTTTALWKEIFGPDLTDTSDQEDKDGEDKDPRDRPTIQTESELERNRDKEICSTDIPERFQLRTVPVKSAEDAELEEEAKWIYRHGFSTPTISTQKDLYRGRTRDTIAKIKEVLGMMRNQHFEVPFIAFYRKESVEPELNISDLWKVWQWDELWTQLSNRKQNLTRLFLKMQSYQREQISANPDKSMTNGTRPLDTTDIERLNNVQTFDELTDIHQHFLLHYSQDICKMHNSVKVGDNSIKNLKQASHRSMHNICQSAGLQGLANKFGITPEQFGENLRDHHQHHKLEQFPDEPLELAKDYVCKQFPTAEKVLEATRYMVAVQIAREPLIQHVLRQTFQERANINIKPTKKGKTYIDEAHFSYSFKYLKNKPVKRLNGDEFLWMCLAEEQGLLTIDIGIDRIGVKEHPQTYSDEIKKLYYRKGFSHQVQEWNKQWALTVDQALTQFLYPQLSKELKDKLVTEAKANITSSCCGQLFGRLMVAPYRSAQQVEKELMGEGKGGRVLGVAYAPNWNTPSRDTPVFCALINGEGRVIDSLRLPYLMKRTNSFRDQSDEKASDIQKLKKFLKSKKPHVVAVAGENSNACTLIEDIKRTISELQQESCLPPVQVELVDNELATLYMNSKRSESEFRGFPPLLRQAVSIARKIQDPLSEYAHVCNSDEDILCLKLHPLQEKIGKEELLSALRREFINRVNEVGVDINRAIANPYTQCLVQYVCGLGPRKGSHLLKILKEKNTRLENRAQLETLCSMGFTVFTNCAGFIKIDTASLGDNTGSYIEVLDGSRIHPESYELARKMVADTMGYDESAEDADMVGAQEEILKNPRHLKNLDLDNFAKEVKKKGYYKKGITLYDIRAELSCMYKDMRVPYKSLNTEQKFYLLTHETPETFHIGKMITSVVKYIVYKRPQGRSGRVDRNEVTGLWQCPLCQQDFPEVNQVWTHMDNRSCPGKAIGVRTRLDNGMEGFIHTNYLSDEVIKHPGEMVQKGMILSSRVKSINVERFSVELTCRASDLIDEKNHYKPPMDACYDFDSDRQDQKDKEQRKKQQKTSYLRRKVVHPNFHNVDFKQAEEMLESKDQGDFIIRPSCKGSNYLAVTWKVAEGIHQHVCVREEDKEHDASLGRKLWIGREEFEDLDEIGARYILPMAMFARDLMRHFQQCNGGDRKKMEELLLNKKKEKPSCIPYLVSACKELPGKFILGYQPRSKPLIEHLSITPEGLKYRSQMFPTVKELLMWFKNHAL